MKFTKMEGCGNDYVYVNGFEEKIDNPNEVAIAVSDRHFGIGSDGLIIINPSEVADFKMCMYNADGSEGKMCGNGIRCVAKYVYDFKLTDKDVITVETLSGIKTLKLNVENGKVKTVRVNMGAPILECDKVPVKYDDEKMINKPVKVDGKTFNITCVSMGNPHAVTFINDTDNLEIEKIGPKFETHKLFPKKINTEFAQIVDRNTIKMRVWERGAGETLACGTGACATMVAANLNGLVDDEADLVLLGGTLHIKWDKNENKVYMTGPAKFVFDGTITI